MSNIDDCKSCELICELRGLANKAEALAPVAGIEGELLQSQADSASAHAERLELATMASRAIYDELGVHVDEVDPGEYLQAAEDSASATDARAKGLGAFGLRGEVVQRSINDLRSRADKMEANCEGSVKGLRVPVIDAILPLPFGGTHCGSEMRDYGQAALQRAGMLLIPAIEHMDAQSNSQDE